ncbi:GDP-mannose mannosyl hydrolase [Salinibius halmophilus]|uniref:GDP-mannose mannosyl hydrolase n=1 Tax=Salinibius halmophilus TaxID=1853216 RepID=UPI000E66F549|nr:GDP-mannose mannosyl hydrolase [Salinibius halmophilus]
MLPFEDFKTVVKSTPLVSIDFVVRNEQSELLVGLRTNKPAQGYWFVPGGRIVKDERFAEAFQRLSLKELGQGSSPSDATFIGMFEHLYEDSHVGDDVSQHYLVFGYELRVKQADLILPTKEHGEYRWLSEAALLADENVHENVKAYFKDNLAVIERA